ncbi:MAG: DUF1800 domain-containing protein, partial [Bacteroidota bacterium]
EIAMTYPARGQVAFLARRDGRIGDRADGTRQGESSPGAEGNRRAARMHLLAYAREQGYRPQSELLEQLAAQKFLRAVYGEKQLVEVLTDFWFNHFNVSVTHNRARPYVLTFERDAIRPHVLGKFGEMLGATARHPAMLFYLDNAKSTAPSGARTTMDHELERYRKLPGLRNRIDRALQERSRRQSEAEKMLPRELKSRRGINENYARELMELHTMGVDGGYSQWDVVEVARAFTGWFVYPMGPVGGEARVRLEGRMKRARRVGFVREGGFLFRSDLHDAEEKMILGESFPEGGGLEEGERVLEIVARHPSTARHVARKMAVRFVSETPSPELVDRLAIRFLETDGDIAEIVRAIVHSAGFWKESTRRSKVKSPFALAVSAVRGVGAEVRDCRELLRWVRAMGEPVYAYQAPTGFPDRAEAWISAGSLVQRMKFAVSLALGRIRGVEVPSYQKPGGSLSASAGSSLRRSGAMLLPGRDLESTIGLLTPLFEETESRLETWRGRAELVGMLIGSPEFQRY